MLRAWIRQTTRFIPAAHRGTFSPWVPAFRVAPADRFGAADRADDIDGLVRRQTDLSAI